MIPGDPQLDDPGIIQLRCDLGFPACRVCSCTDVNGCPEGCYWIEADLCSQCKADERRSGRAFLDRVFPRNVA